MPGLPACCTSISWLAYSTFAAVSCAPVLVAVGPCWLGPGGQSLPHQPVEHQPAGQHGQVLRGLLPCGTGFNLAIWQPHVIQVLVLMGMLLYYKLVLQHASQVGACLLCLLPVAAVWVHHQLAPQLLWLQHILQPCNDCLAQVVIRTSRLLC